MKGALKMTDKVFPELHVLDGAMSNELETRDVDTNDALWTAKALIDNVQAVYDVHEAYFQSGAQLVLTNTYQANVQAFQKIGYSKKQAETLISIAVLAAKKARDDYEQETGKKNLLVAGTIGPYGAYLADGNEYRGEYLLNEAQYLDFHLPRLETILQQEPDCIALETQPKLSEPLALLRWLEDNVSDMPVYVSFTLRDDETLSDGTSLAKAIKEVSKYRQVFAVGINCIAPKLVDKALKVIRKNTTKQIIIYPNLGATYNPKTKTWTKVVDSFDFDQAIRRWHLAGADIIGGCCTTGPAEIKQIADYFDDLEDTKQVNE